MSKAVKVLLTALLVVSGAFASAGVARADVNDSTGTNVQEGSNRSTARQSGRSDTGDAVGGQVIGVVSSGRTSVDASNTTRDSDITTGDADGSNSAVSFTGLSATDEPEVLKGDAAQADIFGVDATNLQEGDNRSTLGQSATATTGDGVGGQVAGVVTAAGGSASVVLANTTDNTSIETGDAEASNDAVALAGLTVGPEGAGPFGICQNPAGNTPGSVKRGFCPPGLSDAGASDITDSDGTNVQEGNNRLSSSQTARAATGDGVGGQVIGVVSAGATSVDATNRTTDSFVETGDADAFNGGLEFAGLSTLLPGDPTLLPGGGGASDISGVPFATNLQDGNNRRSSTQTADASTGDAVAGQVSGVVTAAGGSASVVLANTSDGIDASTGESEFDNADTGFAGLQAVGTPIA